MAFEENLDAHYAQTLASGMQACCQVRDAVACCLRPWYPLPFYCHPQDSQCYHLQTSIFRTFNIRASMLHGRGRRLRHHMTSAGDRWAVKNGKAGERFRRLDSPSRSPVRFPLSEPDSEFSASMQGVPIKSRTDLYSTFRPRVSRSGDLVSIYCLSSRPCGRHSIRDQASGPQLAGGSFHLSLLLDSTARPAMCALTFRLLKNRLQGDYSSAINAVAETLSDYRATNVRAGKMTTPDPQKMLNCIESLPCRRLMELVNVCSGNQ